MVILGGVRYTVISDVIPPDDFPDSLFRQAVLPTFLAEGGDSVRQSQKSYVPYTTYIVVDRKYNAGV